MAANELCILSYNSRGFDSNKQDFIRTISTVTGNCLPIICNQENFLLKANEYIVKQTLPDHHIIFKPASMDSLHGRPKNGMFIAVPKCIKDMVKDVSPHSTRIQSVLITTSTSKIMLINTYFPQDPRVMDFDETELILMLEEIRKIIIDHDFNQVIWTGDINADFKRTTTFVGIIDKFIFDMGICKSWDKHHVDFTHASELNGVTYTSTIDHFFWNKSCNDYITDAGALHLVYA